MEKKSEKNLRKKLNRLSKVAALAFALVFSSITSGHADEDAAELLAPEAYAAYPSAYPWLYFGCVYNLPQCRSITWNSGYRFFWAQTDLYRCPGHMMACWGTN